VLSGQSALEGAFSRLCLLHSDITFLVRHRLSPLRSSLYESNYCKRPPQPRRRTSKRPIQAQKLFLWCTSEPHQHVGAMHHAPPKRTPHPITSTATPLCVCLSKYTFPFRHFLCSYSFPWKIPPMPTPGTPASKEWGIDKSPWCVPFTYPISYSQGIAGTWLSR
jgi:hypothetical protein